VDGLLQLQLLPKRLHLRLKLSNVLPDHFIQLFELVAALSGLAAAVLVLEKHGPSPQMLTPTFLLL